MPKSTHFRPQPPSISDPEEGDADLDYMANEDGAGESAKGPDDEDGEQPDWEKRAEDAFRFSTEYVDSNYRKQWDDSIRSFNNQHASDSKYNSESFAKRSRIYRPKTRSVIRKNEAAAAAAFFSNLDLMSISPLNASVKEELVSAEVVQQLIQYRLTKSIPWFQTLMGAIQDAQVQGACIAHVHWRYITRKEKGDLSVMEDKPVVDLIPIENFRVDPAAHWIDPVNTSPYVIHLIPMYLCDVKERMKYPDPKGRKWKSYSDQTMMSLADGSDDSTRSTRIGVSQDPTQSKRSISDYDIVWIHRHIHRWNGQDYEFYTLASKKLLTDPEPLDSTVFHGKRPYVMGVAIVETHKPMPASMPKLVEGLQSEANEIANQRLDNLKFVLNKRWFAKRGKNVDLPNLVRNVPGSITLMDDPEGDVKEVSWPDVTSSAYLEQDRLNVDIDELAGNFSASSVQTQNATRSPAKTMTLLQAPANLLTEYLLKTFVETFVQPVLRQLILLEQHYETDDVVLALAGEKAQIIQKFGVNEITDQMLEKELTCAVNVGMGATDPVMKLQRFIFGVNSFTHISAKPPAGIDLKEVAKEIFGLSGYQDGDRFFSSQDPDKAKAQQQIGMMQKMIQQLQLKLKEKGDATIVKLQTARENNATKIAVEDMKHKHEDRHLLAEHIVALSDRQSEPKSEPGTGNAA